MLACVWQSNAKIRFPFIDVTIVGWRELGHLSAPKLKGHLRRLSRNKLLSTSWSQNLAWGSNLIQFHSRRGEAIEGGVHTGQFLIERGCE